MDEAQSKFVTDEFILSGLFNLIHLTYQLYCFNSLYDIKQNIEPPKFCFTYQKVLYRGGAPIACFRDKHMHFL